MTIRHTIEAAACWTSLACLMLMAVRAQRRALDARSTRLEAHVAVGKEVLTRGGVAFAASWTPIMPESASLETNTALSAKGSELPLANAATLKERHERFAENRDALVGDSSAISGNAEALFADNAPLEANDKLLKSNAAAIRSDQDRLAAIAATPGIG